MTVSSTTAPPPDPAQDGAVRILAWMMFLTPAVGVPSELILQDTLKSAIVAFGVLLAALLFFWRRRHSDGPLLWHGLVWLPLSLMSYALGSMLWSHAYLAGVEAVRWFILSLLLWLGLNTLTRENLRTLLWGIHAGAVLASLWVVLQFWFDLDWFPQFAPPASTFANRNFFAEYVVSAMPISVWLLARTRSNRWLVALGASVAINIAALLMSGTRSALLALLVITPLLVFILVRYRLQLAVAEWSQNQRGLVILLVMGGVGLLSCFPCGNSRITVGQSALDWGLTRVASVAQSKEYTAGSFSVRAQMWKSTVRMLMAHPWSGVGAGAWEIEAPLFQSTSDGLEIDFYAHNEYLQLLSEYGFVVGGLVLAFLFAYLLTITSSIWKSARTSQGDASLQASVLCSLLALLIVSNAGFAWHLAGTGALLALCQALLVHGASTAIPLGRPVRNAGLVLFSFGLLLATFITIQAMRAEYKIIYAIHVGSTIVTAQSRGLEIPESEKNAMQREAQASIAINPYFRNLVAMVAEHLENMGELQGAAQVVDALAAAYPNVPAIRSGLALTYSRLGQHDHAWQQYTELVRLQPKAMRTRELELILLINSHREQEASAKLIEYFQHGSYSPQMTQWGSALGLQFHDAALVELSLQSSRQTPP